tara:strand:+ start:216 stop:1082 length:867 start_codon:yes stop_codon:yes gene_type:complete
MLIFMVAVASGILLGQYAKVQRVYATYQHNAEGDREQTKQEITKSCGDAERVALVRCVGEGLEAYAAKQATNKDLQAQQDMALWSKWTFFVGTFGVFVSILGLGFLFVSLSQTRTAIKDNREIGEAQVRAYLSVDGATWEYSSYDFSCPVLIKNYGQSPAQEVSIEFALFYSHDENMERRISHTVDGRVEAGGNSLIPAGSPRSISLALSWERIAEDDAFFQTNVGNTDFLIVITGTIFWIDVFNKNHEAQFSLVADTFIGPAKGLTFTVFNHAIKISDIRAEKARQG